MKEVSQTKVVQKLSEELKKDENIKPPAWSSFVKTGVSQERPPQQPDWWYYRSAAVLRRVYTTGPVGVSRLRTVFGDRRRRGHKPAHHRKGGGKIIRTILQQLEKGGYIQKVDKPRTGRTVTPKGQKLLLNVEKGLR